MLFSVTGLVRGRCDLCEKRGDVLKTRCRRADQEACELGLCGRCFTKTAKAVFSPDYTKFSGALESRLLPKDGPRLSAEYIAEVLIRRCGAELTKRVAIIKDLRDLTGLGLKETKDAVDAAWGRLRAGRLSVG
jgi:hypothetical protein